MDGYNIVLVPLDGSTASETALDHAVRVTAQGGVLHLFQVADLVAPHYLPEGTDKEALWAQQSEPAERYLALVASRLESARCSVVTMVGSGSTAEAICHYASDIGAELIVMTTHARTGLSQLLLGSVATEVVKGCGLPVLLIRP
jgi:nucleotide-binding universal stress UspA family protein